MKIGIAGTQCAGKTTLFNALSNEVAVVQICQPHFTFVKEIAREYTDEQRQNLKTQYEIFDRQMKAEDAAGIYFISDRTVFDNIAYCAYTYETGRKTTENRMWMRECQEKFIQRLFFRLPYDIVFFVDEYFRLPDDRRHEGHQQMWVFDKLNSLLPTMKDHCGKCVLIKGSTEDRIFKVIEEMQNCGR